MRSMDPLLNFRAPSDLIARIDEWRRRQGAIPSRSEAMRDLIEMSLARDEVGSAQERTEKAGGME